MPIKPVLSRCGEALLTLTLGLTACSAIDSATPQPTGGDDRPAKQGGTLRVALSAEPDKLDPTVARTLVGRTVFNAICEKLYDVDEKLSALFSRPVQLTTVAPEGNSYLAVWPAIDGVLPDDFREQNAIESDEADGTVVATCQAVSLRTDAQRPR